MSIDLTTQVLSIQNLSQPEKHILTVLCFLSNKHNEVYRTIERLSSDCSCSIKTVERALKKFRDIGYLIYTNKIAPNSKNIPIYRIDFNHGLPGGGKTLTTDSQSSNHGLSGCITTDSEGIWIDNKNKDNKKDNITPFSLCLKIKDKTIFISKEATIEEQQNIKYFLENPQHEMPCKLKNLHAISD